MVGGEEVGVGERDPADHPDLRPEPLEQRLEVGLGDALVRGDQELPLHDGAANAIVRDDLGDGGGRFLRAGQAGEEDGEGQEWDRAGHGRPSGSVAQRNLPVGSCKRILDRTGSVPLVLVHDVA